MLDDSTAVEITKGDDSLDIWVDANDNGVRDDDDVNIYVTANGGFYTTSPTFRQALDTTIQSRIKELAVALLTQQQSDESYHATHHQLRDLALELVVRATSEVTPLESKPMMNPSEEAPAMAGPTEELPTFNAAVETAPVKAVQIINLTKH